MNQKRCLGYHCPDSYRNNCAHHLRQMSAAEAVFQSQRVGEECDNYKPFREQYGIGQERESND